MKTLRVIFETFEIEINIFKVWNIQILEELNNILKIHTNKKKFKHFLEILVNFENVDDLLKNCFH